MAKGKGGRPTDYRPEYCDQIVEAMSEGYSMTAFAGKIGVSRPTLNNWMEAHPEFFDAATRGKAARLLHWEKAALRVAVKGGGPGTAGIIQFAMKNMAPEEYADRQQIDHRSGDGSMSPKQVVELTDEQLERIAAGHDKSS